MGETNALAERRRSLSRRGTFARAAALYAERFGLANGSIPATFEIVFLTGWAPAPGQPQPLRPGSARYRLADALGPTPPHSRSRSIATSGLSAGGIG